MDNVLHTTDYVVASTVLCIILHNVECYIILADSTGWMNTGLHPTLQS